MTAGFSLKESISIDSLSAQTPLEKETNRLLCLDKMKAEKPIQTEVYL